MANRVLFVSGISLLLISLFLMQLPQVTKQASSVLFVNPSLFRAISGPTHTLLADFLWLASAKVGEMNKGGSQKVDKAVFIDAAKSIIHLDPNFYEALRYSVTYLSTIQRDTQNALDLLAIPRYYGVQNFEILFLELMTMITYNQKSLDLERIEELVRVLNNYKKSEQLFGTIDVSDWINEFVAYAKDRNRKIEQQLHDLRWLYKNTKNSKRKAEILSRIKVLEGEYSH